MYMFLLFLGKSVSFIVFQKDKCFLPLLYLFQNLSEDVASDVSDEEEIDELYERSKIVFSIALLDMFTTQMLPVY